MSRQLTEEEVKYITDLLADPKAEEKLAGPAKAVFMALSEVAAQNQTTNRQIGAYQRALMQAQTKAQEQRGSIDAYSVALISIREFSQPAAVAAPPAAPEAPTPTETPTAPASESTPAFAAEPKADDA